MALHEHVAILAHSSLHKPSVNRLNPEKPPAFYAQVAFPPSAIPELQQIAAAVAPGGQFAGLEIGLKQNQSLKKPLPGVPGDYWVVRSSTNFAPYVADGAGQQLDQANPATHSVIQQQFYAGKKVRAALSAFYWRHDKTQRAGISFNLQGIMASDDGERLNIGSGVVINAFNQYADPSKAAGLTPVPGTNVQTQQVSAGGNPFTAAAAPAGQSVGAGVATGPSGMAFAAPAAQNSNPFASGGAQVAQSANPFVQQGAVSGNPFAQ